MRELSKLIGNTGIAIYQALEEVSAKKLGQSAYANSECR